VIGEGGSGGALAIGVGDWVQMLEYSIYSVISPEGCASILWKDAKKAEDAAEALGVGARRLLDLKLIDAVLPEPLGGAHRNIDATARTLKEALVHQVSRLDSLSATQIVEAREKRLMAYGRFKG